MQYKSLIIALGAVATLSLGSCGNRDILEPIVEVGQPVPTCYWEVGSTACKAGETFSFQGKYTVPDGSTPAYSQVWYRVKRDETATATVKLAGASLAYSKSYSSTDTLREYQPIVTCKHDAAEFDGYEYVIKGEVPVSRTLSPISWIEPEQWDAERFASYYPKGFDKEFCETVVKYLTADSAYYNGLRQVYVSYPFTMQQIADVNAKYGTALPTDIDMTGDDLGSSDKSDRWFSTSTVDATADKITGYYYFTIDAAGNAVVHEIAKDAPTFDEGGKASYNGNSCYPVYASAPWVFCRYNDDLGAVISTVRANYMPAFAELLSAITFPEWIYDSANKNYKVEFSRKYSLDTQFRVYDTAGEEGIANDVRIISIN